MSSLPVGDATCPDGGQQITSGSTSAAVCNGLSAYTATWTSTWTNDNVDVGGPNSSSTTFPAGTVLTPVSVTLTGDFSTCAGGASVNLFGPNSAGADKSYYLAQWTPTGSVTNLAPSFQQALTFKSGGGYIETDGACPDPVGNLQPMPSYTVTATFTVTPPTPAVTIN